MNRLDLAESVARTVTGALGIGILEAAALAALVFTFARLSRPSATTIAANVNTINAVRAMALA